MLPVFRIIACQLVPAAVVTVLIITENYIVFCADISDFPINNAAVRVVSAFGTGNRSSCDGRRKAHQQAYAYHSRQQNAKSFHSQKSPPFFRIQSVCRRTIRTARPTQCRRSDRRFDCKPFFGAPQTGWTLPSFFTFRYPNSFLFSLFA